MGVPQGCILESHFVIYHPCCCLPTPLTLVSGGEESDDPACLSLHLASSSITPAGSVHKSRGNSVVRIWVPFEEMVCVVCVGVVEGE